MNLSKTLMTVGAGALSLSVASLASAIDGTITSQSSDLQHIHINLSGQIQGSTAAEGDMRYDAIPGPYASLPAGDGQRGFSFYQTAGAGSSMYLGQFQFIGGTDTAGGSITFNFYNYSGSGTEFGSLANSFSVELPQAGTSFLWTITLDPGFEIPTLGAIEMVNGTGGLSRWFLTGTAPAVGTSFGSPFATYPSQAFALIEGVPAPGALALLGVAGLARGRRRR
jgi:MYXO-CTERM domain-containing protein